MQVKDDLTRDTCTLHILCFQESHCLKQPLSSVTAASVPWWFLKLCGWQSTVVEGGGLPPTPTSSPAFDSNVGGFTGCAQGGLWLAKSEDLSGEI